MGPPCYKSELELFFSNESEPIGANLCKLNKFLKSAQEALQSESDKDNFISSIPNETYFGKKTRLELANVLRRPGPIFDTWKSEDKTLLHRSLDINWIFTDSTISPLVIDPDFVVAELFPSLSHSCRQKVVRQMGKLCLQKDAEVVTKIYAKLLEIYGLKLAKYLIPACDQSLIDSIITAKRVKLEHNQLLTVFEKYPESAIKYLNGVYEELYANTITVGRSHRSHPIWANQFFNSRDSCPYALRIMAKTNPSEFMNLFEKYHTVLASITFGRKLTHHLIRHDLQRILSSNNINAYAKLLYQKGIMHWLKTEDYDTFFVKLFPQTLSAFQTAFEIGEGSATSLFTWLDKYAPNKRFEKLDNAFRSAYGKSVLDFPEFVTSKLLQLLSPEMRNKWVDIRLSKPDNGLPFLFNMIPTINHPLHLEGYWEAFRPTDKSIPRIKQYLATEPDVNRRSDLVGSLLITCSVNDDKSALKEVCQFVSSRFRNDTAQVRLNFLGLISTLFDLLKLDEDHWKPINELLHISSINNEFSYGMYVLDSILEKSIHFRLRKDLPVDTQIQHFIKMKSRSYCTGESWCIATSEPGLERKCLKLFTEHLSSLYPLTSTTPYPSDSATTYTIISLFESYAGFNRRQRNSKACKSGGIKLDLLTATESPWLMKRLQDVFDSYHDSNKQRVILALNEDPKTKAMLLPRLHKSFPVPSILSQLLKKDPKQLDELTDEIIDFLLASNKISKWRSVLRKFKTSGLPRLTEKFANKCLGIAEDDEESLKERTNSIYILSFLLDAHNFASWIPKYYPSEDSPKFDHYTTEEIGVIYAIRKMITQSLSNLSTPSAGIEALSQFCKGDYLKLSIGSLYSIVEKSPTTQKLLDFLTELSNRPVSVKKHAIRLMISISTKIQNVKFLTNLWDSELHYSIRTILFNQIFKFFIENNSEESYQLLKSSVTSLSANDHPFLRDLGRSDYILSPGMPNDKISEYFKLALDKINSIMTTMPEVKWVKVILIQCITSKNIEFIDETFLKTIFEQHLFNLKDESDLQSALVHLAINYLLYYSNKSTKKMETITVYLEKLLGPAWTARSKDSYTSFPAKQSLSFFVEQLTFESFNIEKSCVDEILEIFSKLQKYLHASSRDVCEFFVNDLFLSLSLIFHTHCRPSSKNGDLDLDSLFQTGKEIGKLVDECVKLYKPEVVYILSEALTRFISLRDKTMPMDDESNGRTRTIFVIDGILESTGSIDTKIVASHLIFMESPQKGHKFEDKYEKIIKELADVTDKTVQIFVNYGSAQCRSNRGFDILV